MIRNLSSRFFKIGGGSRSVAFLMVLLLVAPVRADGKCTYPDDEAGQTMSGRKAGASHCYQLTGEKGECKGCCENLCEGQGDEIIYNDCKTACKLNHQKIGVLPNQDDQGQCTIPEEIIPEKAGNYCHKKTKNADECSGCCNPMCKDGAEKACTATCKEMHNPLDALRECMNSINPNNNQELFNTWNEIIEKGEPAKCVPALKQCEMKAIEELRDCKDKINLGKNWALVNTCAKIIKKGELAESVPALKECKKIKQTEQRQREIEEQQRQRSKFIRTRYVLNATQGVEANKEQRQEQLQRELVQHYQRQQEEEERKRQQQQEEERRQQHKNDNNNKKKNDDNNKKKNDDNNNNDNKKRKRQQQEEPQRRQEHLDRQQEQVGLKGRINEGSEGSDDSQKRRVRRKRRMRRHLKEVTQSENNQK